MSKITPAMKKRLASSSGKKRVLHVNSAQAKSGRLHARFTGEDWEEIRLDPFNQNAPDILGDWSSIASLPDATFDAVWNSHSFQQNYTASVPDVLTHCHRVLKEGGVMLISVPDLQSIAKSVYEGKSPTESLNRIGHPVITALDLLFGAFPATPPAVLLNKTAFTGASLGLAFKKAGFFNIEVKRGDDFALWCIAYRLPPDAPNKQEKIIVNDKYAPRGFLAPSGLSDELNVPPHLWKSPGLKKE